MKKLMTWFGSLPREVKMMLALLGLASPIGAIYLLQRLIKGATGTNVSTFTLILIIAGVVIVIALLGWLIAKLFRRGSAKRNKKMAAELSREDRAGPVSMDVRGSIKANNEKFFNAIKGMKKELGVNIYDLPWYIIIGDSGCGKTKLINESGLTFSTGKPEGYQLGTLNYNWWFTEDAIFIDMAGRLCNPQDDSDAKEWQAFLQTISRGRKGFPINGAIVAVSAEHLLQDPAEKHEADANTALERLRDLQKNLGVTFATYLVVTKCDRILGFMQFFDRAERDIQFKNQIFGWSKPGEFNELYDPEEFGHDFDMLYGRLTELRLRRLSDEEEEVDLGLAYSFPEEFRELRAPLQTYIRTLFPMIKNPRAIKNLIMRGVYFTSATQQGSVILKHLAERLGNEAVANFQPLEALYPRPRPHFVKDVLVRKAFPEYGLVFRNEQDALKNKRYARMLQIGSAVMLVVAISAFAYGLSTFKGLIGRPRAILGPGTEGAAPEAVAKMASHSSPTILQLCQELGDSRKTLREHTFAANLLSFGMGSDQPIRDIQTARSDLFENGVLRPQLAYVEEKLRTAKLPKYGEEKPRPDTVDPKVFADCLTEYLRLCRYMDADNPPPLDVAQFEKLFAINKDRDALEKVMLPDGISWDSFKAELDPYVEQSKSGDETKYLNPAKFLREPGKNPIATAKAGLDKFREYLRPIAQFTANHPNEYVRRWMALRDQAAAILKGYSDIISLRTTKVDNVQDLNALIESFKTAYDAFDKAVADCHLNARDIDTTSMASLKTLSDIVAEQRRTWYDYYATFYIAHMGRKPPEMRAASPVSAGATSGAPDPNAMAGPAELAAAEGGSPNEQIKLAIDSFLKATKGSREEGLDVTLVNSLDVAGLLNRDKPSDLMIQERVQEVYQSYAHVLKPDRGQGDDKDMIRSIGPSDDVMTVAAILREVAAWMNDASGASTKDAGRATPHVLADGIVQAEKALVGASTLSDSEKAATTALGPTWKGPELSEFLAAHKRTASRRRLALALERTASVLKDVSDKGSWGIAELWDESFGKERPSFFTITAPPRRAAPEPVETARTPTMPLDESITMPKFATGEDVEEVDTGPSDAQITGTVPACATADFIKTCISDEWFLRQVLAAKVRPGDYLPTQNEDLVKKCREGLTAATKAYLDKYFSSWKQAYEAGVISHLDELRNAPDWATYQTLLTDHAEGIGADLRSAMLWLVREVVWAEAPFTTKDWTDERNMIASSRSAAWKGVRDGFDPKLGQQYERARGDRQQPHWVVVPRDVQRGWQAFSRQAVDFRALPMEFEPADNAKPLPGIDWQALSRNLTSTYGDVTIIRELKRSLQRGRDVLNIDVHNRLAQIQDRYEFNSDGFPYDRREKFKAVGSGKFGRFLKEMIAASDALVEIEAGLVDCSGQSIRKNYYQQCLAWRKLISGSDKGEPYTGNDAKLGVHVEIDYDPTADWSWWDAARREPGGAKPQGGNGSNYYGEIQMCLGLTRESATSDCLSYATDAGSGNQSLEKGDVACWWNWPAEGGSATIKLSGAAGRFVGYNPADVSVVDGIGEISQLLLPAFLQEAGRPFSTADRKNWRVGVRWDLPAVFAALKMDKEAQIIKNLNVPTPETVVGTKFRFRLDRDLPEPIKPLKAMTTGG